MGWFVFLMIVLFALIPAGIYFQQHICPRCGERGAVWLYSRRDGGPDRRYKNNYLIHSGCKANYNEYRERAIQRSEQTPGEPLPPSLPFRIQPVLKSPIVAPITPAPEEPLLLSWERCSKCGKRGDRWLYQNLDGSADARYKDNVKIHLECYFPDVAKKFGLMPKDAEVPASPSREEKPLPVPAITAPTEEEKLARKRKVLQGCFDVWSQRMKEAKTKKQRQSALEEGLIKLKYYVGEGVDEELRHHREQYLLLAASLDVADVLEKVASLRMPHAKQRQIEYALEQLRKDDLPDELQAKEIEQLEGLLAEINTVRGSKKKTTGEAA